MTMTEPVRYDPYDHAIALDPHPTWRRLRDEAPLYRNDEHDFWALSRFEDVVAASADWHTYSSARGTVLEMMDTRSIDIDGDEGYGQDILIFMDPPGHDVLRRLVSRAFTPRRVASLEDRIRELCARFLDELRDAETFDFVEDFGAKIPSMVIGELLGVPRADQDQLRTWGDAMMRYEPDGISQDKLDAIEAHQAYVRDLIAQRTAAPADDMTSDLVRAEIELDDGTTRQLTDSEVFNFVGLLELAGSETTARLLGWAAVLLARHPDQRALLVDDPGRIPNAVEELLRYEAPSPIQARFVTADVVWHGETVPAGSRLALLTGSAGRDERAFPDADRFDVTRHFDRHVSFGHGVHYCLGANLARLEARIALEEALARVPDFTVDPDEVIMVRTTTVRGPAHVPVVPQR